LKQSIRIRTTQILAAIAALSLLTGCPTYKVNMLPQSQPLSRPIEIDSKGDYTHEPSHSVFPLSVADFARINMMRYDTNGLDVSGGYNQFSPQCKAALTVYIAPAAHMSFVGAAPDVVREVEKGWQLGAYERWKKEVMQFHQNAVLKLEDDRTQQGIQFKHASYAIGDSGSELGVAIVDDAWVLSYRVTYPLNCETTVSQGVTRFFDNWHRLGN